jgi:hypothetical protein
MGYEFGIYGARMVYQNPFNNGILEGLNSYSSDHKKKSKRI